MLTGGTGQLWVGGQDGRYVEQAVWVCLLRGRLVGDATGWVMLLRDARESDDSCVPRRVTNHLCEQI